MTFPADPSERSPKGDHNRRLSLGIDADEFAATAGVSREQLRAYEFTDVDGTYDPVVAERVGRALERLEAAVDPKVDNGPIPQSETTGGRVAAALQSHEFVERLALADMESAEQMIASELISVHPGLQLLGVGERARGPVRELVVGWRLPDESEDREEIIALPTRLSA